MKSARSILVMLVVLLLCLTACSLQAGHSGQTETDSSETKQEKTSDMTENNWEWTQERYGSGDYVMRGGGYNLMGGACRGSDYPAALCDPLSGNVRHPNVVFRVALFVK